MNHVIEALDVRDLLDLVDDVCRRRRVTREDLCGRGRTKAVSLARHEVWWRLRHNPEAAYSFEEIGRLFGRHHATVIQGIRAHDRRLRGDGDPAAADQATTAEAERARPAAADRARGQGSGAGHRRRLHQKRHGQGPSERQYTRRRPSAVRVRVALVT
jgi:hypothetical protein